jgi:hypothetical protein
MIWQNDFPLRFGRAPRHDIEYPLPANQKSKNRKVSGKQQAVSGKSKKSIESRLKAAPTEESLSSSVLCLLLAASCLLF